LYARTLKNGLVLGALVIYEELKMEFIMKKFTIKTRVALSLLLSISMTSASDRSWRNYSRQDAQKFVTDTYESGKEYAQSTYDYARNNPGRAAAVGVGVGVAGGLVYKGYNEYKAYMARNRRTFSETVSDAGTWINKNVWRKIRYKAKERAELERQEQEYEKILADIEGYTRLKALGDTMKHEDGQSLERLGTKLSQELTEFTNLQKRTQIQQGTFQALTHWHDKIR